MYLEEGQRMRWDERGDKGGNKKKKKTWGEGELKTEWITEYEKSDVNFIKRHIPVYVVIEFIVTAQSN